MDYWLPVEEEDVEHIQPIRSKKQFDQVLDVISKKPEPFSNHFKSRKKNIHERWKDGKLISRAKLLRDLHGRLMLDKLNFSEKEMYETVKQYFINEWIIADEKLSKKMAIKRLTAVLRSSISKVRTNNTYGET